MSEDNIQVTTDVTEETELDKYAKGTWIQAQIDSHNIQREAGRYKKCILSTNINETYTEEKKV